MDAYKKSYYNKKFSNDLNFALQGKRAAWSKTSLSFLFKANILIIFWFCHFTFKSLSFSIGLFLFLSPSVLSTGMVIINLFEHIDFVLLRGGDQVISIFLVVLGIKKFTSSGSFRCLWSFVGFFCFVLSKFLFLGPLGLPSWRWHVPGHIFASN